MVLGHFHGQGVLFIWLIVGQEPTALAAGAGYGVRNFSNGPLSPKQSTRPNEMFLSFRIIRLK